jgi:hypothetical protein
MINKAQRTKLLELSYIIDSAIKCFFSGKVNAIERNKLLEIKKTLDSMEMNRNGIK